MESEVRAVAVDFDGTIVSQDVSEEILERFAGPGWWEIDLAFQRGEIGCRECLVRQAELLRGQQDAFLEFALDRYRVDPTFPPFVEWAHGTGIDVSVASDGFGFYIEPMLAAAGVHGVTVLTNRSDSAKGGPPLLSFPHAHPVCVGCGTCKMNVVLGLRERTGGSVAFVGEGHSDRYGALYADLVFAKSHLVDVCLADGVPFVAWDDFGDVRAILESRPMLSGRAHPARCPGWSDPA